MLSEETGGKHFSKQLIVSWIKEVGITDFTALQVFTGLPEKLLLPCSVNLRKKEH